MEKFPLTINQIIEQTKQTVPQIVLDNLIYASFFENIIFDLWIPESDIDLIFVYIAPPEYYYGISTIEDNTYGSCYISYNNTRKKIYYTCYELSEYIELLECGSFPQNSILWSNINLCQANSLGLNLRLKKTVFLSKQNLYILLNYIEAVLELNLSKPKTLYQAYLFDLISFDLLKHKRYVINRSEEEKKTLLSIKNGELSPLEIKITKTILKGNLNKLLNEIKDSSFPDKIDHKKIEKLKMTLIEQHWFTKVPNFRKLKTII